jgi:hypothetical protein
MIDVSAYIIEGIRKVWGEGNFTKSDDELGNKILIVELEGLQEFEIDLKSAESAILEDGVNPDDYAYRILKTIEFQGEDEEANFNEIAKSMELVFTALSFMQVDYTVGDCVEDEEEENMCIGLWINIGIYPIPFYFKDTWENLVRDDKESMDYVRYVIFKHTGKDV